VKELLATMFDYRDLTLGNIDDLLRRAMHRAAKRARQLGRDMGTPA
jgi:hypothetical protein